jgi:hypothetical protein
MKETRKNYNGCLKYITDLKGLLWTIMWKHEWIPRNIQPTKSELRWNQKPEKKKGNKIEIISK